MKGRRGIRCLPRLDLVRLRRDSLFQPADRHVDQTLPQVRVELHGQVPGAVCVDPVTCPQRSGHVHHQGQTRRSRSLVLEQNVAVVGGDFYCQRHCGIRLFVWPHTRRTIRLKDGKIVEDERVSPLPDRDAAGVVTR